MNIKSCAQRKKYVTLYWGRHNLVGIAIRKRMEGSEFEPPWQQDILSSPHLVTLILGPSLLYNGHRGSLRGVKRTGSGVEHPPHLAKKLIMFQLLCRYISATPSSVQDKPSVRPPWVRPPNVLLQRTPKCFQMTLP